MCTYTLDEDDDDDGAGAGQRGGLIRLEIIGGPLWEFFPHLPVRGIRIGLSFFC